MCKAGAGSGAWRAFALAAQLLAAQFVVASVAMAQAVEAKAASVQVDPYKMVEQTTQRVLAIIADAKGYYEKDPERFQRQVDEVMSEVVDFDSFARGVMGPYANLTRLSSGAERAQRQEQIARFSTSFRRGLIETYAKGLLKFDGQRIETLPPRRGEDASGKAVAVVQNIHGKGDQPYVVQYSMRRNGVGEWKVHNVIIEGINLGQTYRNQFTSLADRNRGDIDKVIAEWRVEPETDGAAAGGAK
jgi:phospholipid transport system substrate-binding protein